MIPFSSSKFTHKLLTFFTYHRPKGCRKLQSRMCRETKKVLSVQGKTKSATATRRRRETSWTNAEGRRVGETWFSCTKRRRKLLQRLPKRATKVTCSSSKRETPARPMEEEKIEHEDARTCSYQSPQFLRYSSHGPCERTRTSPKSYGRSPQCGLYMEGKSIRRSLERSLETLPNRHRNICIWAKIIGDMIGKTRYRHPKIGNWTTDKNKSIISELVHNVH